MKRIAISITITVLFIGLMTLGRNSGATSVHAQESDQEARQLNAIERPLRRTCNIGTISGSYAYQASGTVIQPIPQLQIPAGPFAANSLINFNTGTFTATGLQNFNGTLVPLTNSGTYTINDDCTGTAIDNGGVVYNFIVTDGGNEIRAIIAVPGVVVTATAKRI